MYWIPSPGDLEILARLLRRADTYLVVLSSCALYLVAVFDNMYVYWPGEIIALATFSVVCLLVAAMWSFRYRDPKVWVPYGILVAVDFIVLIRLRSHTILYVHPLLLLLVIVATFLARDTHANVT